MKNVFVLTIIVVAALLYVANSPVALSQAVQLPDKLVTLIGMGVLVLFTAFAKWVFERWGIDISDRAAEIAASLAAVIVLLINYLLGLVPAAYDSWISAVFAFLIVLFGGVGIFSLFLRKKNR